MATESVTATWSVRRGQYLGYAAGEVANNLTFQMVSAFVLIYYTDVAGISAAAAGTLLLLVRVWGGFTDLFSGRSVDRTSTRWGKFRPYLLFGPVPLLALLVAIFSIPGGLGEGGKLAWAFVTYALFSLAYSFVNIPYGSLAAAMTQEPEARAQALVRPRRLAQRHDPADRRRSLASDRVLGRSPALPDDHDGGLRGDWACALAVVLPHLARGGAARRGQGWSARHGEHDPAQPATRPALRFEPPLPHGHVLALDHCRLLRPQRARRCRPLHRHDRRPDGSHGRGGRTRAEAGRGGGQEARLHPRRSGRRRLGGRLCTGPGIDTSDRYRACSVSASAQSTP
jgi:hypothetical protein